MKHFTALVSNIESTGLKRSLLTVVAWIFVRIFFEGVLETTHRIGYIPFSHKALVMYLLHFPLFYISLFLLLVIVTTLITGDRIKRATGACAAGFGLIILVPVIDWVGGGYTITYPYRLGPYILGALNPFVSIVLYGGSPGQRIILFLICVCIALYGFVKTKRIGAGILLFCATYFIVIIFGGLPTIAALNRPEAVYITGGILYSDTQKFTSLFLLLALCSGFWYLWLNDREKFMKLVSSIRFERALFYAGMGFFGLFLALHQQGISVFSVFPSTFDSIGIIIMLLCLAAGFQGAAAFNDFHDRANDRITRSRNPLVRGLAPLYYTWWTVILWTCSLACALLLGYVPFLIMLTYLSIGILYSMPPVRLKRVPVLSTFVLAVAVVLSLALGYSFTTGPEALNQIPRSILLPTLMGVTLGFTAKDIHDIGPDRAAGVYTIPVLLISDTGRLSRLPVALIIASSYIFYALFIRELLWGTVIFAAITIVYTMTAQTTKERVYFLLLYLFGAYLMFIVNRLPPLS